MFLGRPRCGSRDKRLWTSDFACTLEVEVSPRTFRYPRHAMSDHANEELTAVLDAASRGDRIAAGRLLPMVYDQLRALAGARMRHLPPGQTLQATALVHEAWLRIADRQPDGWDGRAHFFYAAARSMRDIIVEDARRKGTLKRGGDRMRMGFDESWLAIEPPDEEIIALDESLSRLEQEHPDEARIVALRYFTGLTNAEVADIIGVSVSSIERGWRLARAWLRRDLRPDSGTAHGGQL